MKICIAAVLLVLSLEALATGRLSAAVADDHVDTIRLPSNGRPAAAAEKKGAAGERPWECCDLALCTRSWPPMCRCVDQVEQCAATCKSCEPATAGSSRLVCNDWYHGFPGPKCMKVGAAKPDDDVNGDGEVSTEVAGHHEAAAEMAVSEENSVVDGEKPRPWKCCDDTLCTRSAPPTCACNDKVKKCAKTCKKCEKDESDASRFVCRDRYLGWPGPKCTEI